MGEAICFERPAWVVALVCVASPDQANPEHTYRMSGQRHQASIIRDLARELFTGPHMPVSCHDVSHTVPAC